MNLPTKQDIFLVAMTVLLAIIGYLLFAQNIEFEPGDYGNNLYVLMAKFWSLGFLLLAFVVIYLVRHKPIAPALAVFSLSAYFVIMYGILFIATDYGMNGHWGDNSNRIAEICKMMAYNSFFQDWYLKDLPSFYPPLWLYFMSLYAKFLNIEAYQTVKQGYLLIFIAYPWLLYFSWKKIVKPATAAAIVVATIFFGFKYIDWIYYEHFTAALFIPWWLYYFERYKYESESSKFQWGFYVAGALYGGAMFMIYYYWFFMALLALPFTLILRLYTTRSFKELYSDLQHKTILMTGVALVSMIYWLPLLRSIFWMGSESAQNVWFGMRHTNLNHQWETVSIEAILIYFGIFFAFYLWDYFKQAKLVLLFLGGYLLILVDRYLNLSESSFQSRKIMEFIHVFALAPAGIGFGILYNKIAGDKKIRFGIYGVLFLLAVAVCNSHTEMYKTDFYKNAVKQEVPERDLAIFDSVNTYGTTFLTTHYIEACYRPYYLFVHTNNMTAHTAGRLSQRKLFLDQATKITEPELLAYCFKYNRYSPIDYVYLPLDKDSLKYSVTIYEVAFDKKANPHQYLFNVDFRTAPDIYVERHYVGLYELAVAERNQTTDQLVKEKYPDIYWHLQPKKF